jgi:uncharacterized protein (TIRG00374 family)
VAVPETTPDRPHRSWRWWTLRAVPVLAALAVAGPLLAGRRSELTGAATALRHLRISWLLVAVGAEVGSVAAYVGLQHRLLASSGVPIGLTPLTGITLAGTAIQNSLPGGAAWSGLFAFRQLRRRGADTVRAGWTLVAVALVSDAGLATLFIVGLVAAHGQTSATDVAVAVLVTALLVVVVGLAVRRSVRRGRGPDICAWLIRRSQWAVRRPRGDASAMVERAFDRLRAVHPTRRDWAQAFGCAVANWTFDCSCLAAAFATVHAAVPWRGLLLAYGTGQLAANLPITPGGLGVVEGSLSIALVYYGGVRDSTVAAVLLYRIISYWSLLPLGWGSWVLLQAGHHRTRVAMQGARP